MASMMDSLTKLGLFQDKMGNFTASAMNGTGVFPSGAVASFLASAGQATPLMQLVLFVYRLIGEKFGIDPSVALTLMGFLWGAQYVAYQIYNYVMKLVETYLMCSIAVSENDNIYYQLMQWLSKQPSLNNHRYLMAQTVWRSAWDDEDETNEEANLLWTDAGQGDENFKCLNFSNQAARSSPRFVPAMGTTMFWHKGCLFKLSRKKETLVNTSGWSAMKDVEEIRISCYGRSIAPIKGLLSDAKTLYYHDTHQKTTIYRPRQKEQRRDYNMWQQVARRPVRPMQTVVLDSDEKRNILADVNDYLHPRTPRWYASRGIPLRRGYLFHGPPGTGKTSFSFALAGVFGIDIYVISLQDISISEEDLASLFTRLPRRCIVLLEDIDTAGLRRDDDEEEEEGEEAVAEGAEGEKKAGEEKEATAVTNGEEAVKVNGDTKAKTKRAAEKDKSKKKKTKKSKKDDDASSESDSDDSESEDDRKSRRKKTSKSKSSRGSGKRSKSSGKILTPESISLSGLLNAIDGVASHEGRVLIMTTNKPESLDEALVRPGRVDMQVAFTHASSDQAGMLFHRMYEAAWRQQPRRVGNGDEDRDATDGEKAALEAAAAAAQKKAEAAAAAVGGGEKPMTAEELKDISAKFGAMIPEGMFSPAEIQGFLLKRKNNPRKALADAQGWIEATIKQKEAKSKVSTVQ